MSIKPLIQIARFGWRVFDAFITDRCPFLAAGLCYFVFFSIFPLLLVLVAVAGYFLSADQAMAQVMGLTHQIFPQQQVQLNEVLHGVMQHRGEASLFGFIVLLWSAKNIFSSFGYALNVIWQVPNDRGWLRETILATGLALSVGVVIFVISLLVTLTNALTAYRLPILGLSPGQIPGFLPVLANTLPAGMAMVILTGLYTVLPNIKLRWRDMLPGSIAATVLWELLRRLFGYYLDHMARYDMIYGSLSGIVGFLFWIYLSAGLFLLGAEVSKIRLAAARPPTSPPQGGFNPST